VIVRVHAAGERIPLTIADSDPAAGTITLFVQGIGKTTKLMNMLETGDSLLDVVGPLGKASEIKLYGTVVVIGGGVGTAIAYPTSVAMKQAGNHVISIIGARSKDLVILEQEIGAISDQLIVTTDDGSYGRKAWSSILSRRSSIQAPGLDLSWPSGDSHDASGGRDDRPFGIKTVVSLNSIMVDGTGCVAAAAWSSEEQVSLPASTVRSLTRTRSTRCSETAQHDVQTGRRRIARAPAARPQAHLACVRAPAGSRPLTPK